MTKHLTGVPPVRTTHASSFKKIGDPDPGSWNRVCVKFQQLIRTLYTTCAQCALPLLCPDGAAGVAARDEAVQPRPLCEQHHQGGGRGSLLDLGTAIDVHLLGGIARARRRRLAVPMLCLSCAKLVAHLGQTALLYRRHVEVEGLARPGQQTTAQSMRSTYGAACNQSRRSCSGLAAACAKLFVADGSIGKQATRAGRIAEASRGSQEMLTVRSYARRLRHHRAACKVHALRAQCARLRAPCARSDGRGGGTRDTLITSPCTVALDSHVKVARVLCSPCGCVVCSVLLCVVCGGQCGRSN